MHPESTWQQRLLRRDILAGTGLGLGAAALATLLGPAAATSAAETAEPTRQGGLPGVPHFAPRARHVIYLCQSGGPSQLDLYDYKPQLAGRHGSELPAEIRRGQRLTSMTAAQASFPVVPSIFRFQQHGSNGTWLSELLPHTARVVDDLCILKAVHTEAINHDPAITFMQTGAQLAGRPSLGAWLAYGLGTENENLPAFVVAISGNKDQPLYDRLWGNGFLPAEYQGVKFRSLGDPVLYLTNPPGISADLRRGMLDDVAQLNRMALDRKGDAEIATRVAQYELAFRMQTSVPALTDTSDEPANTFELYGETAKRPGTFAANCLLARRLVERGVRFIQLYHRGWDQHDFLPRDHRRQCLDTDQPAAALVADLKQRGLLDETLIIWAGEFGRTVYCQGRLTDRNYGRDHHPRCFSIWLAGGGIKPGMTFGETDDFSYNIVREGVHVHDLNATLLHCLGIDHERLTYKFQGRRFRLTDVEGRVVKEILA
jgi:hypothetical protein